MHCTVQDHEGKGHDEPHQDFDFYPTGTFRKPLERQVDEARRIDWAEEVGKAFVIVGGKTKEIKVNKALLNRKEERFNLGNGMVRASFGTQQNRPKPPPPLPASSIPVPHVLLFVETVANILYIDSCLPS